MADTVASKATGLRLMWVRLPPLRPFKTTTMKHSIIADEQPMWVCQKCAEKYSVWLREQKRIPVADYHTSMCDVCLEHDKSVTRPENYGLLVEGWNR